MSTTTNTIYTFATQQISIYLGIPILIGGILGGILNIIVFLSLQTFRESSCAFFLTIMSFVNIGQLITGLLSRVMISGFGVDWTETSIFYCKFRISCLQFCALTSYTCMCLATIDQLLATSLQPRWQQCLNLKKAYRLCAMFFFIWLLHSIPSLIWYNLSLSVRTGKIGCVITNSIFQQYFTYVYLLILAGILPIIINITFGSIAYCNVRQIPYRTIPLVRRELDKQLTTMVLVQVVFKVFVIVPYITVLCVINTANLLSSSINITQLTFANFVTGIMYYLYFATPFYIYISVSKRFRQQFIHVISITFVKRWKRQIVGINRVSTEEQQQ
ncbi:unnamed protein product [Rotaria sp. Silwood1]|nr:unnamed protein product [Rotaria sp. Silwood1]CAF1426038.1 unnamed protein product [Rotaria sp. Silwood1]CAF3570914.1 unnamed protein product [Rotaria sp. Silwood1]CAF3595051.1 unnamed protein product [Rotaria sp. Silwood1]CAF4983710.1 unnamed protein product [Rotaria sp. Silwood1]